MAAFDHVNVLYDVADSVATLTLNRPEKRNALDDETIAELKQFFAQAEKDDDVRVVVLRGAGNDFCAGADLSQLEKIASNASREENLADAMNLGELFSQMRKLNKPIIAAVQGNALAGGAGLANACDVVLAGRRPPAEQVPSVGCNIKWKAGNAPPWFG